MPTRQRRRSKRLRDKARASAAAPRATTRRRAPRRGAVPALAALTVGAIADALVDHDGASWTIRLATAATMLGVAPRTLSGWLKDEGCLTKIRGHWVLSRLRFERWAKRKGLHPESAIEPAAAK